MKTKFGVNNFFSRANMEFRITRYDSWNDKLVVIANSSNHDILEDHNSVSYDLESIDDAWTLIVGFTNGFSPSWFGWATACIVIGSLFLSLLMMLVLVTTKMNKMLLYRMMPRKAIIAVKQGKTFVERDSKATILFSHLIGFQDVQISDFMTMLTQLYSEFDKLALRHKCIKIETIGACYIVKAPGPDLSEPSETPGVERIALFALEAMELVRSYEYKGAKLFRLRCGFATGPIVSGVIASGGLPKYTVFGDIVNFSSRMESTSKAMKIQIPHHTFKLLRHSQEFSFDLEEREEDGYQGVYVKGKGQTMTYWLKGYTSRDDHDNSSGEEYKVKCNEEDDKVPVNEDIEKMTPGIRDNRVSFKD